MAGRSWTRTTAAPARADRATVAAVPNGRPPAAGSPVTLPMNPFRLVPTTTGRPSPTIAGRSRSRVRLWSTVLPKPMPGSNRTFARVDAGPPGGGEPVEQEGRHVGRHVGVGRVGLHGRRRAPHVHQDDRHPAGGDQRQHRRVVPAGRDVVDDGRPASRAAAATAARVVSTEIGTATPGPGSRGRPARRGRSGRPRTRAAIPAGSTRRRRRSRPPRRRPSTLPRRPPRPRRRTARRR